MKKLPKIAESEWKVMRIIWAAKSPLPAYDIIQQLSSHENWQPKTIRTLLNRLVKKNALGYQKYKNLYLYYALVSEVDSLKVESESFLRRCFDGSMQPMLAYFVEHLRLSADQIDELKKILDKRET